MDADSEFTSATHEDSILEFEDYLDMFAVAKPENYRLLAAVADADEDGVDHADLETLDVDDLDMRLQDLINKGFVRNWTREDGTSYYVLDAVGDEFFPHIAEAVIEKVEADTEWMASHLTERQPPAGAGGTDTG